MDLQVRDHADAQRYEITADGAAAGFLTYRLDGDQIALLHAEVDPAREGQGIGSELVAGALQDARSRGLTVRPVCPFVVAYLERHPEDRDLLTSGSGPGGA